jgi:outer membrane protein W
MKKRYLILIFVSISIHLLAQGNKKPPKLPKFNKHKDKDIFLDKQFWLGFKAGANLSGANVQKSYSPISPTNYEPNQVDKKYKNFKDLGSQATLEVTFYYKGISFSFQPTYRHSRFIYTNAYSWAGDTENPDNRLELNYEQEQKVDYLDLPLLAKYELIGNKLRPFIQVGIYNSRLLSADKSVQVSGTDYASGGTNHFENEPIIVGATDLFAKNHWGLLGGIGVYYNLGNVRLNLDVVYKKGMSNISSTKNRYGSDRLSGVGDTQDDLKLSTVSITAGCLFPLRFLAPSFRSSDRQK